MTNFKKSVFFFLYITLLFLSLGCDKIQAYFAKDEQRADIAAVAKSPVQMAANPGESAASAPTQQTIPQNDSSPAGQPSSSGNVLAKIGSWMITIEEFNERLQGIKEVVPEFDITSLDSKKLILEELVRQQLIINEAESNGLAKEKDIIEAVEEFRRTLLVREMVGKIVQGISITEEDAKKYYEENKAAIVEPLEFRLREIVLETQLQANEVAVEALKGVDFAQLAQQHSKSKSASQGGDLGFLSSAPFPEMAEATRSLEAGGISTVFKGPDGFYIVKIEEKKGGKEIPFETVKDEITQGLTQEKQQQAIINYINELKQKSSVEVNEKLLEQ